MFELAQVNDRIAVHADWFKDYKFHLIKDIDQLSKLVGICITRGLCSLDLETTGVDNRIYKDDYFEDGITTRYGMRTIDKIVGVCISFDGVNGYYTPLAHEVEDSGNLPWDPAWDLFERLCRSIRVIFHNGKFDKEFLYPVVGIEMWDIQKYEDTFLVAKVISPNKAMMPAGLKPLAKRFYDVDMIELDDLFTKENRDQLKKEKQQYNCAHLHPKEILEYGCSDGIFTYKLYFTLIEKLTESDQPIYRLEKAFCNVLQKMERNRVHLDVERVQQLFVECKAAMRSVGDAIRQTIEKHTGKTGKWLNLNIGSPKQLSAAFITDEEGLKLKPTSEMLGNAETGFAGADEDGNAIEDDDDDDESGEKQYSLKDDAIKSLDRAYGAKLKVMYEDKELSIFDLTLEYRHYDKMKGSYIEKFVNAFDKYGDVRPSFNQMGTDTARLASKAGKISDGYSGVNFQGIPRDSDDDKPELFKQIRTVIIPRKGKVLVKIDYAGEELRVITNMSGDPIWTRSFLFEDGDVHSITAKSLFQKPAVSKDERNRGKRCNFAIIYGGGAGAIQRNIGCSMEDAQRSLNNMRKDLPALMGYVDHQKVYARKNKCVYTAFGRRMPIPTIDSPIQQIRKKAERCAINYTIQATSADILKFAMCFVDKKLREHGWQDVCIYVLTVHDEIVFEIEPAYLMEIIPKLDEWMTTPWKMKKVHGRQWTVPLLTEPGIDIHWRARFDFFAMTNGAPANPKDIDADGQFIGKLKSGQAFENGRVYQIIPEFLQDHIKRAPIELPKLPPGDPELPAPSEPVLVETRVSPTLPEAKETIQLPVEKPVESVTVEKKEGKPTAQAPGIQLSDDDFSDTIEFDTSTNGHPVSNGSAPNGQAATNGHIEKPADPPKDFVLDRTVQVLRWTIRAPLSEHVARKMHAVCILAEGKTPLRVVNTHEKIVISEDSGIRVDSEKFRFLADLFGLG
jgi:DNA polymerase I-like protein with 3'-5' exonuclease and polymerase domains